MTYVRSAFRVLLLVTAALFVAQFAWAKPAAHDSAVGNSAVAQETPARSSQRQVPPKRQVPPATPQAQTPTAESGEVENSEDAQTQLQLQQQMDDIRHQLEQEAINRMRSHRSDYGGFDRFMDGFIPFLAFVGVTLAILWILRTVLDNRRWYRMVKVQTETHAKLLDRFSSGQEMLAYMQSEAGRKFLEAPVFEGQRRQVSALPFGRILWSVQIGIVAAFVGIGILFLRGRVPSDASLGFEIFGTLILTLGLGFLVSGGVSYVLAKYFGLLERQDTLARPGHNA